jgi:septal ring factor EnvC (AmiA/AmiB activator)
MREYAAEAMSTETFEERPEIERKIRSLMTQRSATEYELYQIDCRITELREALSRCESQREEAPDE